MNSSRNIKLLSSIIIVLIWAQVVGAQDANINIPSINVNAPVTSLYIREMAHGTTWDTSGLVQTVGYLTGTSWFGQSGNIVLGGHSELGNRQPDVFYNLDGVVVGDIIHISANGTQYNYVITSLELVSPDNLSSILPTGHDQLTIITCDTGSFNGSGYLQRLIVRAVPF